MNTCPLGLNCSVINDHERRNIQEALDAQAASYRRIHSYLRRVLDLCDEADGQKSMHDYPCVTTLALRSALYAMIPGGPA